MLDSMNIIGYMKIKLTDVYFGKQPDVHVCVYNTRNETILNTINILGLFYMSLLLTMIFKHSLKFSGQTSYY